LPEVDTSAIALLGFSFGGYLAARASAFEDRLAATICLDGMWSFGTEILSGFPPDLATLVRSGAEQEVNGELDSSLSNSNTSSYIRWFFDQGLFAFKATSPFDFLNKTFQYDLTPILDKIPGPIFLADTQDDMFGKGQGLTLSNDLGSRATYHEFLAADGASEHCSLGAANLENQVALDWVQSVFESKKGSNANSNWPQVWTWV
jgi:pimeloyl-ACP methyl ester carboxylesterase